MILALPCYSVTLRDLSKISACNQRFKARLGPIGPSSNLLGVPAQLPICWGYRPIDREHQNFEPKSGRNSVICRVLSRGEPLELYA